MGRIWEAFLNWLGYGPEEGEERRTAETVASQGSRPQGKLVTLPTARGVMRLMVVHPQSYEQGALLAENLKNYRPVIVNLEKMPPEEARRLLDFLSGAVFALGGRVSRVGHAIFVFAPSNVDLSGDLESRAAGGGPSWPDVYSQSGRR
ncbi:MAG TPA: cell division protein SepF [Peptococcaceae bacterium]|nr:MAG: Cell division protein SepF [Moorella sp. 60_41]HBT48114.1 cell division protein SepF [Peptococcaceae bacterium]